MTRCVYCGHVCRGKACRFHKDLLAKDYYVVAGMSEGPGVDKQPRPSLLCSRDQAT